MLRRANPEGISQRGMVSIVLCIAALVGWSAVLSGCRGPNDAAIRAAKAGLQSRDAKEVTVAVGKLAALGPAAAVVIPDLVALYGRSDFNVRLAIVQALPLIDPQGRQILPLLRRAVVDRFINVRARAVSGLRKVNARSEIPLLTSLLADENRIIRGEAAHALALMVPEGRTAIRALQSALAVEKDGQVRAFFTLALVRLAPENPAHLNSFRKLFSDRDPEARQFAIIFLRRTPIESAERLRLLATGLRDADALTRRMAIRGTGQLGEEAASLMPILFERFRETEPAMSREAIRALGRVDPQGERLTPYLVHALKDPSPRVRADAAVGLGQIANPAVLPDLMGASRDPVKNVRLEALRAIGRLGPAGAPAVPMLLGQLAAGDREVGFVAAETLSGMGAASFEPLRQKLLDPNPRVRERALFALGSMGPQAHAAKHDIESARRDPDADVRAAAAQALQHLGNVQAQSDRK